MAFTAGLEVWAGPQKNPYGVYRRIGGIGSRINRFFDQNREPYC